MKILLISPASGKWRQIGKKKLFNGRAFRFSMLSLLTVAKLCPQDADIKIVDEQLEEIPWHQDFDLVGITAMTATAPRAYKIADRFRNKGTPVVLGGFHPTLNKEEALEHADAVVLGPAFGAWEELIEDYRNGGLKRTYSGNHCGQIPAKLPRQLVKNTGYVTVNATYATMGCKNRCRFCSISKFYNAQHYTRSIDDIVNELKGFKERFFIFVDDNLTQNRDYAKQLFSKIAPLKKKWITQASIELADDNELLGSMREAGCVGVFIGLETFNTKALLSQEKTFNTPDRYKNAIKKFHKNGIFVESGIIFGFDTDGRNVFANTLHMLKQIGIDAIQVSILTPLPGTQLHNQMKERITDRNWEHYDYRHVVFKPAQIGATDLQAGADWVIRRFYSPLNILKRTLRWLSVGNGIQNLIYPLGLNLAYLGRVRRFEITGYNPVPEWHNWEGYRQKIRSYTYILRNLFGKRLLMVDTIN